MTPRYPNMQGVSEYAEDSSGDRFNLKKVSEWGE